MYCTHYYVIYIQTNKCILKRDFFTCKNQQRKYLCNNHDIELYNLINDKFFLNDTVYNK